MYSRFQMRVNSKTVFSSPLQRFHHRAGDGGDNVAVVGVLGGEGGEDEFAAVGELDVGDVVARAAGPTGSGPQTRAVDAFQGDAGEAVALVVVVVTGAGVVALQQVHHQRRTRRSRGFAGHDLHHQTRRCVSRQLVAVLAVGP